MIAHAAGWSASNPGDAGVGAVLVFRGVCKEVSRFLGYRSREFSELMAVKTALEMLKDRERRVVVRTGSSFCHDVLVRGRKPVRNQALVRELRSLLRTLPRVEIVRVEEGVVGREGEIASGLAREAVRTRCDAVRLVAGPDSRESPGDLASERNGTDRS